MTNSYLISITDACALLSVGRTTVYGLLASGKLEKVKIGRRTLVTRRSASLLAGLADTQEGC